MRLTAVLCVLLAAQVAACGSSEPARTPIIDDTGTALEPLPPDPAFEAAARELCPRLLAIDIPPAVVEFQDRRRDDMAFVSFSTDSKVAGCLLRKDADGTFEIEASHQEAFFNSSGIEFGLNSMSWLRPNGYFISGRVPEAVEAVWLERDDGLRVRTSLAHGMFEAWWRGDIRPTFVVAESAGGIELRRTPVPADFFS